MKKISCKRGFTQIIKVILNPIQDLQRLPLQLVNNVRGRSRIKYGMTSLFNNRGFTLIELLVVVLIIGILAAVAVPQYQKAVVKTKYANLRALTRQIQQARIVNYLSNGTWEKDVDGLDIGFPLKKKVCGSYCDWYFDEDEFVCMVYEEHAGMNCRRKVHGSAKIKYEYYIRKWLCCGEDEFTRQICKQTTGQENTVTWTGKTNCYEDGQDIYW